eukprot:TRINITY_DN12193_c0_g1_i3.p2 TRINITY_DN12193_c0_g1~~TRINITY_DN12193_c0_g1_i3.p2  ORF type:complete len:133 (-),score=13.64 TRINITY_DN12193_c0_g1_i3:56-454(-)
MGEHAFLIPKNTSEKCTAMAVVTMPDGDLVGGTTLEGSTRRPDVDNFPSTYRNCMFPANTAPLTAFGSVVAGIEDRRLSMNTTPVSYTHLRAHETPEHLVCRLLLEKKKKNTTQNINYSNKLSKKTTITIFD